MRIKDMRTARGMTQQDVADALGIARVSVTNWERSARGISTANLIKLAKLFECSVDELLESGGTA